MKRHAFQENTHGESYVESQGGDGWYGVLFHLELNK